MTRPRRGNDSSRGTEQGRMEVQYDATSRGRDILADVPAVPKCTETSCATKHTLRHGMMCDCDRRRRQRVARFTSQTRPCKREAERLWAKPETERPPQAWSSLHARRGARTARAACVALFSLCEGRAQAAQRRIWRQVFRISVVSDRPSHCIYLAISYHTLWTTRGGERAAVSFQRSVRLTRDAGSRGRLSLRMRCPRPACGGRTGALRGAEYIHRSAVPRRLLVLSQVGTSETLQRVTSAIVRAVAKTALHTNVLGVLRPCGSFSRFRIMRCSG